MISMAGTHCDPSEHGDGSDHCTGSLALGDGSIVAIARLHDGYALHVEPGTATDTVCMDRGEVRQLALTLIDASQHGGEE
jgi:hypothetical protein